MNKCPLSLSLSLDVLKFDNSYSWTRSKEVFYFVKILPPNSELSEATPTQETGFNSSESSDEEYCEANEQAREEEERKRKRKGYSNPQIECRTALSEHNL